MIRRARSQLEARLDAREASAGASASGARLAPDAFTRMVRRADLRSAATVVRVVARWAPDLDEHDRAEAGRIAERLIQLASARVPNHRSIPEGERS